MLCGTTYGWSPKCCRISEFERKLWPGKKQEIQQLRALHVLILLNAEWIIFLRPETKTGSQLPFLVNAAHKFLNNVFRAKLLLWKSCAHSQPFSFIAWAKFARTDSWKFPLLPCEAGEFCFLAIYQFSISKNEIIKV